MSSSHRYILSSVLAILATLGAAGPATAAAPTDPQAAGQQPLEIMRVGDSLEITKAQPADVPVLVADTGLDLDHPDIAPRLLGAPVAGSDFAGQPNGCAFPGNFVAVPDNDPTDPAGCSGHGTAVAGVLGAAWNNGAGGAGIAPNARFIPFRTCYDGDACFQYVQAAAFDAAVDIHGARVVSMSWLATPPLEAALAQAITDHPNTLFVAIPSGGPDGDIDGANRAPCAFNAPNVLCVTPSGPGDEITCGAFGDTDVDVAVPTQNSVTTLNGGGFGGTSCATSFAAPTAAGLATILFGLAPQASGLDVKNAIIHGARKSQAWQGRTVAGGVADAVGAVNVLANQFNLPKAPALELSLVAKKSQPAAGLRAKATCNRTCDLALTAKGKAGKKFRSSDPTTARANAGTVTQLKVTLSKKVRKRVKGEAGKAKLTAFAAAGGTVVTDQVSVKLKK